jgi:hypothetical protein
MSTWVGVTPLIGAGSLDGFAVGALMSGACSLAIIAPRRARRRKLTVGGHGLALAVGRPEWENHHVRSADVFGADSGRGAHHEEPDGRPVVGRHRLVNPGGTPRETARPSRTSRHAAFPGSAFPGSAFPGLALPDLAFPDGASGPSRRPEGRRPRHAAPPVGFSSRMNSLMTGLAAARVLASGAHG